MGQPALEEIRIDRHLATPMRGGVKLYGDLYRPKREGKFPIVRTPYGVQRDGVHQDMIHFAQRGYAVSCEKGGATAASSGDAPEETAFRSKKLTSSDGAC